MEPLTCLGLAENIVQFVDFSWRIWMESRDIYESANGASEENDIYEMTTKDLMELDDALIASAAPGAVPDQLRQLASRCREVASELFDLLEKIKVKGSQTRWKTFVAAARIVWKKEQINDLNVRMERLRDEMHFRLQWMFRWVTVHYYLLHIPSKRFRACSPVTASQTGSSNKLGILQLPALVSDDNVYHGCNWVYPATGEREDKSTIPKTLFVLYSKCSRSFRRFNLYNISENIS